MERIDLGDPQKYPEFYNLENSFDLTHLNDKGARKSTLALARELMALGRTEEQKTENWELGNADCSLGKGV